MVKKKLTRQGYDRLLAEHEQLLRVERPRVVQGVAEAAAEGDRSENAEYIYGRKRLREIDKRLQYLSTLLKHIEVVEIPPGKIDTVVFGTMVKVRDDTGALHTWTIVGEGETEGGDATISYVAPVAAALLGRRVGDVVTVDRPIGEISYQILEITRPPR